MRADQAQVGRPGGYGLLNSLLVAVTLGGDHDHRALAGVGCGEVRAINQRGPPAERPREFG